MNDAMQLRVMVIMFLITLWIMKITFTAALTKIKVKRIKEMIADEEGEE